MNKPYDQRIINHMERPTSSDLNIAQSQLNSNDRALMRYLFQAPPTNGVAYGALGDSFKPSVTGTDMNISLNPGMFTTNLLTDAYDNIGTITGLNDDYPQRTIFSSAALSFTVPTAPTAGKCRRDLIAIRPLLNTEKLTDYESTDIYNPPLNAFSADTKSKTLTSDVSITVPQYLNQGAAATDPIIYIKGNEQTYVNDDTFLTFLPPGAPAGYANLVIVNVKPNATVITANDIIDHRRQAAPYGNITLTGKATVGWHTTPGGELSDVVIRAPAGIRASIYKAGANAGSGDETNSYVLAVFGARAVTNASISFSVGIPAPDELALSVSQVYPAQIATGTIQLNTVTTSAAQTYFADPAKSSPTQTVAVNQGAHFFPFTLGTIENVNFTEVVTGTAPVLGADPGDVTVPAAPSQEYEVTNLNRTPPPLYVATAAISPAISGLLSNTYELTDTPPTDENTSLVNVLAPSSWTEVVGFLTNAAWLTNREYQQGLWQLQVYLKSAGYVPGSIYPQARIQIYKWDGTTKTLLTTSSAISLPGNLANIWNPVTFSVPVAFGIDPTDRIYITVSILGDSGDQYTMLWGASRIAEVQPPILMADAKAVVTSATYDIQNSAAGSVSVPITVTTTNVRQKFNPKATTFQRQAIPPFEDYSTVPITFTVNLSML